MVIYLIGFYRVEAGNASLITSPLTALAEEQVRGLNAREQVAVRMNNESKKTMNELEEKLGKFLYCQYLIRGETHYWE
jgi:superfamily II DNA helicase RecQ